MAWTFYRYVGPEQRDVVLDWIKKQPAGTSARIKAALDVAVIQLQLVERERFSRADGVGQLRRKCGGFFELLLWVDKAQYRPIGVYGPGEREFTILSIDREKGDELIEDPDCERPKRRKPYINDRKNIIEYFSKKPDR